MKKCWIVIVAALLLTGCGAQETFETISDVYVQSVAAPLRQVVLLLPEEAAVSAMENAETGTLYLCDGYSLTLQTMEAGDLDKTLRQTTGFAKDKLTLMETQYDGIKRYACVWSAAGEGEDQVGRATILDDGSYHYVLTAMAGASQAGALSEKWQEIFDSFSLTGTGA